MKTLLAVLLFLISFTTIHANTDDISLPEIASYGRGIINDVAWHPTEDVIAVASGTGVWLYDTDFNTLGQLTDTFVDYVNWNDDGRFLATGLNSECQIWENPISNPQMFMIDDCEIGTLAWYESKFAFQSSFNQENLIYIYDLVNPPQISMPIEVNLTAKVLHWSPDGSEILVLGYAQLALLDSATGAIIGSFVIFNDLDANSYMSFDNSIQWDNEKLLILCSETGDFEVFYYICEWDISTNTLLKHYQILYSMYFHYSNISLTSPTEIIYISSAPSPYMTRLLWQQENLDDPSLPDISSGVDAVAYDFNPEQSKLIIASRDGRLIIYDTVNNEILRETQPHIYAINDLAWHPTDGRLAVTGYGLYYDMQIWQLEDNQLHDTEMRIPSLVAENVDWNATDEGSEITISGNSRGDTVDIFNFGIIDGETYETITYSEGQSSNNPTYEELMPREASNNGEREVVNDYRNNEIRVELDFSYQYQEGQIFSDIIWSPDDMWLSMLVSGDDDPFSVLIWDTTSWDLVYKYSVEIPYFSPHFAWSPNSDYLAFALELDTEIHIINMNTLDENTTIQSDYLTSISWSPNSQFIVIGSRNLAFYNLETSELVATIDGYLQTYDWRADGAYLAGGNRNGTVQVWDMRPLVNR